MEGMIGEIRMFAGNFAPRSWALCEGQLLPIAQNAALFSILGTIYGGDGRTTFALPDLRGRVPIGPGNGNGLSPRRQGERSGQEHTTLNVTQLPTHTHPGALRAQVAQADGRAPVDGVKLGAAGAPIYTAAGGDTAELGGVVIGNAGGNQSTPLMQPWLGMNFIICMFGVFPSRN